MDRSHLAWPFFEEPHRELAASIDAWAASHLGHHDGDVDAQCRALVKRLGEAGWLRHAVAGTGHGGAAAAIDTRAICLLRETLAWHHGLADFAFAMQGLGSGAISLHGTPLQRERYLPRVARGDAIAPFALSGPAAGPDPAAPQCRARPDGHHHDRDGAQTGRSHRGAAAF